MAPTQLVPTRGRLTLDDLESLAFTYGGTVTRTATGWKLIDALIDGRFVTLGPVTA